MDPPSPETRWQHIVFHILMSGELFHIQRKMKINCFSVLCGEQGMHLHFLLSLINFHICKYSVFLYAWATGLSSVYFGRCSNDVEIEMSTLAESLH